jgi:hypothetical protein
MNHILRFLLFVLCCLLAQAQSATQPSGTTPQEKRGGPRTDIAMLTPVTVPVAGKSNYKFTLKLPDGTRAVHYSVTINDDEGTSTVTGNWPSSDSSGEVTDVMTLEKGTLLLRKEAFRRFPKPGETSKPMTIDLDFSGNKASGITTSATGETKPVTIELAAPIYPGGVAIDVVIGCLPLAEGYATTYRYWDIQALKESALQVKVVGTQLVGVSAETFDCWKVELTTADGSEKGTVWITKGSRTPIKSSGSKTLGRGTIYSSTELARYGGSSASALRHDR